MMGVRDDMAWLSAVARICLCASIAIISAKSVGKPIENVDPVAEGFPSWTGLSDCNHIKGRELRPSDLRHKVTIVVALESDVKLRDQLKLVAELLPKVSYRAPVYDIGNWQFPRKYICLLSCRGSVGSEALSAALAAEAESMKALKKMLEYGGGAYRDASFSKATDPAGKCPYVYVLGPTGSDPIWQGTLTEQSLPQAVASISRANKEIEKSETKWRPFYGTVNNPKFYPQLSKAIAKGKQSKTCSLDSISRELLAGVQSSDTEKAKEAQVLYDAIIQTCSDLKLRIVLETKQYPHVALADMSELIKYWPKEKKNMEKLKCVLMECPNVEKLAGFYTKIKAWSDPDFNCRSTSEAKKVIAELNTMKKQFEKLKESKNIATQNAALSLDSDVDALIKSIFSRDLSAQQ